MVGLAKLAPLALIGALLTSPPAEAQDSLPIPEDLPPGVTPEMVLRGKVVFEGEGMCYTCHGEDAGGLIGPTLTDPNWWYSEGTYPAIIRQILVGVDEAQSTAGVAMPPRGGSDIDYGGVQAVAAFVWRVSHPTSDSLPAGVTPEMIEAGDEIFHDEGRCYTCHGADATGDLGPNLTDETWLHVRGSYLSILQQILTGVPEDRARTGIPMPPRGGTRLSDDDVHAVAAYVWALSRGGG